MTPQRSLGVGFDDLSIGVTPVAARWHVGAPHAPIYRRSGARALIQASSPQYIAGIMGPAVPPPGQDERAPVAQRGAPSRATSAAARALSPGAPPTRRGARRCRANPRRSR